MKYLSTLVVVFALVACSSSSDELVTEKDVEPIVPKLENQNPQKKYSKAAAFTSATVCMLADPTFWEDFWDDDNDLSEADSDAQMKEFYKRYGYDNERQALDDVTLHVDNNQFRQEVALRTKQSCSDYVTDELIAEVFNSLKSYEGNGQ